MPFNLGPGELLLILAIALVVLGPKKLPEAGRSLGRGLREFKNSVSNMSVNNDEDEEKPSLKARNGESASA
jgi:sec-independent protein translocase protein TatA